jgi:hypothetical protein
MDVAIHRAVVGLSALLSNPSVSCFGRLSTLTHSLQQLSDQRLMLDPALSDLGS